MAANKNVVMVDIPTKDNNKKLATGFDRSKRN